MKTISPPMSTTIVSATSRFDHPIRFWDDGMGPLWLYRDAGGTIGIVRAQTWEDAYECVLDEILQPISVEDAKEAFDENGELMEGYQFQPNSTGTGIVSIDLNGEQLEPLTVDLLRRMEIKVKLSAY